MNLEALEAALKVDEGFPVMPGGNARMYQDSRGIWSIGWGFNLQNVGLYPEECEFILGNRIGKTAADLDTHLSWWRQLDDVRQNVLLEMAYNEGVGSLLGFHDMLFYLKSGFYDKAADAGMDSLWAKQVGDRAVKLMNKLATGG